MSLRTTSNLSLNIPQGRWLPGQPISMPSYSWRRKSSYFQPESTFSMTQLWDKATTSPNKKWAPDCKDTCPEQPVCVFAMGYMMCQIHLLLLSRWPISVCGQKSLTSSANTSKVLFNAWRLTIRLLDVECTKIKYCDVSVFPMS